MGISIDMMALCLAAPMIVMMFLFDGKERRVFFYLIIGFITAVVSAHLNTAIGDMIPNYSSKTYSAYYGPVVEEIIKAVPVFIYFFYSKKTGKDLFQIGMTVGVGFAVLENVVYMSRNLDKLTNIQWVLARGFATGVMHAICTSMVAYMITIAYKHRKMYVSGTIAALAMAMTYHSIYNIMIKTEFKNAILFMPIITFFAVLIYTKKKVHS